MRSLASPKLRPKIVAQAVAAAAAAWFLPAQAATLDINFDSDPTALFEATGGTPGPIWTPTDGNPSSGGYLTITDAVDSQSAFLIFKDADGGKIVTGFTFTADVRIGNDFGDANLRGADGFSISFARSSDPFLASQNTGQLAAGLPEAGTATGLAISFDAWSGNVLPDGPDREGVIVRLDNRTIGGVDLATRNGLCADQNSLQTGTNDLSGTTAPLCWQPIAVTLATDGKLTVSYKGRVILNAFQTGYVPSPGRLVFAGRTGSNNQIQHVDNIHLVTTLATAPVVSAVTAGLKSWSFQIFDNGTDNLVDPATVVVKSGATVLTPTVTKVDNTTTVTYSQATVYPASSTQTLTIDYKDTNGNVIPTVTRSFVVPAYAQVYSIGLNFGASEPLATGHLVDPNDGTVLAGLNQDDVAGVAAVAQGGWNNMVDLNDRAASGANGSLTGLSVFNKGNIDASTAAATYVEWHCPNTWTTTAAGTVHTENYNNFAAGADRILMTGYLDTANATTTRITITNLPAIYSTNGYEVWIYASGTVTLRGGGYRILTPEGIVLKNYKLGTTVAAAPSTYTEDLGVNHTDVGDYLRFPGLVARDIVIEATTENGLGNTGTPRAPVEAVQLVLGATALTAPVIGDVNFTPQKLFFTIADVPGVTVDPSSITVKLDTGSTNIPVTISKNGGITTVSYDIVADKHAFFTAAAHTLNISVNGGAAVAKTFTVAAFTTVDVRTSLPFNAADTTKPGYRLRVHGYDNASFLRGPGDRNQTIIIERALNNGFIDPSTGLPYDNRLVGLGEDAEGYLDFAGPININNASGDIGKWTDATKGRADVVLPGGVTGDNYEVEFVTYLKIPQGYYRFAVNSDDGFRASIAPGQDAAGGQILGQFNGGRGEGTPTFFDFAIPQDGVYPFRLTFWQGTGGQNIELWAQDILTAEQHLVGDFDTSGVLQAGSIGAYRAATNARPSIRRALPVQNWIGGYANDDIIIESRDDTNGISAVVIDPATVKLVINGTNQTTGVTVTKTDNITKLVRAGSLSNLLYSGVNTIQYIRSWTEGGTVVTYTNQYNINVAPYFGAVPPAYKVPIEQIDTSKPGFFAFVDQMDKAPTSGTQADGGRITGGGDGNRMPRPEQQLAGSEMNPVTGLRYPNIADKGPNGNWTYTFDIFNFRSPADGAAGVGLFTATAPALPLPGINTDAVMPGLPGAGFQEAGRDNSVMETITYLNLKKGVYVLGVNSDDGYVATVGADPHDTLGVMVGHAAFGRGNSGNLAGPTGTSPYTTLVALGANTGSTPFSLIVSEDGIYPMRILFWEGGGGVNAEFFMLNKDNGEVVLVNDLASADWVPAAYSGYTGPARPWTRFSVSPTPWENRIQQAGPDSLKIWGRTPSQINSNDIVNDSDSRRPFPNTPIGGVIANGASESVRILLDGADVTASADVSTSGTDKTITYKPGKGTNPLLASGSTHTASLVYANGTNSWTFRVQPYITVDATNRLDFSKVSAADRGFQVRAAQASDTSGLANTVAARETQLAGTPVDTFSIKGPGPRGEYFLTNGVINWSIARNKKTDGTTIGGAETGNFENSGLAFWPYGNIPDTAFPGVVPQGNNLQNFAEEIIGYLEFPTAGFYRFGANGDDGWRFQLNTNVNLTAANQNGVDVAPNNPNVPFSVDRGAGNQDIPFGFVIPAAGIYPMRVVYYQGGGGANFELFTYDDAVTGGKILVNDPNNPKAIKSYFRLIGAPTLSFAVSGNNLTLTWTAGATLQSTPAFSATTVWTDLGTSGSLTIPLPGPGDALFYRVKQ